MSYLETVKKQSPYGHLPNFAILSKNKLYLPNVSTSTKILGKWSLEWIDSDRFVIGFVEQDDSQNVSFKITSCYEFTKSSELQLINRHDFIDYWSRVYKHEPLLTLVKIVISDYYNSNGSNIVIVEKQVVPKEEVVHKSVSSETVVYKSLPKEEVVHKSVSSETVVHKSPPKEEVVHKSPPKEEVVHKKPQKLLKEKVIGGFEFTVCKTEKPDVYYVYKGDKQFSSCLISNLKTSLYMQNVFEHKNIGDRIGMNLKLHESTKRYIPIIE
jgi:hypothetical protein